MQDNLKVTGVATLTLRDQFGNIKQVLESTNLVVSTGRDFIASRMIGVAAAVMSHMAVGTSSTAAATGNTTLGGEVGRAALATPTVSGPTVSYSATFGAGVGTGAIVEAGILNAGSSGTLLCRTVFAVINKAAADSLTINWNVTINAS